MSYLPVTLPTFSRSTYTFGVVGTRINLTRVGPTTYTTSSFTVPAVDSTVTVGVSAASSFVSGDFVSIGTRVCLLKAPVHSNTGAGSFIFSGYLGGSLSAGNTVAPTGHTVISVASGNRTTNTNTGWIVPNNQQSSDTVSISVANRAMVDSGGIVMVTNYAGLYQVVGSPPTSTTLNLKLVTAGDLLPGATCIQETSRSYTGAPVSQGYVLARVENVPYRTFFPVDALVVGIETSSYSPTSAAAISLGFSAGSDTGRTRFGDFLNGRTVISSDQADISAAFYASTNLTESNNQRLPIPFGMPLMACVTTASNSLPQVATIDLMVRGYFSQG